MPTCSYLQERLFCKFRTEQITTRNTNRIPEMLRLVLVWLSLGGTLRGVQSRISEISSNFGSHTFTDDHDDDHGAIAEGASISTDVPDVHLPTLDMVRKAGYYAEAHVVETEDGYFLTLHRIPGRVGSPDIRGKPSVILQHGLLSSSADWVIPGREKALAYILVDRGYDVWLGNARGNTYSRAHASLSISDSKFWNFTWHEMGIYDLPAIIEYITEYKKEKNILYVGHSMGTTMFYVMASERPDVARKVKAMFSLAPVAFLNHVKSPIRIVAPYVHDIEMIIHFFGEDEFLPQSGILRFLARYGCDINVSEETICANALFVLCGFDQEQFNNTLLPIILGHSPAGTSTKTLIHYAQGINSGEFRQYDYGKEKNLEIYHSVTPPAYNLTGINVPVSLHYADNDWLASITDVKRLYQDLPKTIGMFRVNFPKFNHLDFLWGIDAPKLVYEKVIYMMGKYKNTANKKWIAG
ncbi:lipase 3-like [Diprion similis]|uniref:lipase 3-like n=1 Tax=Diprion similis TaxID=362088 RepID=UPI001EF75B54|nr:lipase 3-like [Diprion similis]